MAGWTEYDLAQLELHMREKRLQRAAMMPELEPHRPIRSTLARTLMTLANHLSAEQVPASAIGKLTASAAET